MQKPATSSVAVALSVIAVLGLLFALVRIEAMDDPPDFVLDPDKTTETYSAEFERAAYAFSIWTLSQSRKVYEWNYRSTQYLFWASLLVTVSGITFAFWQFSQAARFERAGEERDEVEFKTQMASLSFKTRSIAVLVLLVSVAYFLIYVTFVYEVKAGPQVLKDIPSRHLESTSADFVVEADATADSEIFRPPDAGDGGAGITIEPDSEGE